MSFVRLPASGKLVVLRQPGGREDLLLAEASEADVALAIALLSTLAQQVAAGASAPEPIDWWQGLLPDVDAALLALRREVIGDRVVATVHCTAAACRAPSDLEFRVSEYVADVVSEQTAETTCDARPGWFSLRGLALRFRLPTAADLLAISGCANAEDALAARCVEPVEAAADPRVGAAMEALAPSLARELHGTCAECGADVRVLFDPLRFVLDELRDRAASIYDEIHTLASRYGWSEDEILSLSRQRRARYVERVLAEGART
jgi:hypothetical protein